VDVVGFALFSIVIIMLAVSTTGHRPGRGVIFTLIVLLPLWFAIRSWLVRVELSNMSLRLVGWFTSREIPRSAVDSLVGGPRMPVLVWTDQRGRKRHTVVSALQPGYSPFPIFKERAAENRAALLDWIGKP
jgi:hypothetical protein